MSYGRGLPSLNTGRQSCRCKVRFSDANLDALHRGEFTLPTDSVEKQRVAGAESNVSKEAQAPFLLGFAHLLRCRKDLG